MTYSIIFYSQCSLTYWHYGIEISSKSEHYNYNKTDTQSFFDDLGNLGCVDIKCGGLLQISEYKT